MQHPSITTISDFFPYLHSIIPIGSVYVKKKESVFENEVDCQHQEREADQVIQPQLCLKSKRREDDEHGEGDHLLYYFQLQQGEAATVTLKADAVGRHLEAILEKGDEPADQDHPDERQFAEPAVLSQLQVAVPCQCHKDVGNDQQADREQIIHTDISKIGCKSSTFPHTISTFPHTIYYCMRIIFHCSAP